MSDYLSLEDRLDIQELVNRFCHYSDYGEWDKLHALYTNDVVTELVGLGHAFRGGPEHQVIHAKYSFDQSGGRNRHYNHNLIIDAVSADEALACYYVQQFRAPAALGGITIQVTARLEDRVVRTSDGWRIKYRRFMGDQAFMLSADELALYD